MVENRFDEKEGILYVKISGEVGLQDMFQAMGFLIQNNYLPKDLKILEDARQAKVLFNISDLDEISYKMKQSLKDFDTVRHAVIHSSPKNSAFTIIISQKVNFNGYLLKEFSSEKSAKAWLKFRQ
ncbi:MAG: hypothetical protein ACOYN5_01840 [Bacteroidales bacterium]